MKIGLYGGSFNPVHYGHLNVARSAIETLGLDRLFVIPANVSPFKVGSDDKNGGAGKIYEWADRLTMVKSVFASEDKVEVDDRELKRGGVSYAIDTVREYAGRFTDAEIFFIIGEDSVAGLPRWKDYEELKKLCTFISFPRTKESSTEIREFFAAADVRVNPDSTIVAVVRDGLIRKGGFCPCRLPRSPQFFCPCDEFKTQMKNPEFHGFCHCRLYEKR